MSRSEDWQGLAGGYVLGVLEGAELAQAERLIGADPEFAGMVAELADRFNALDDTAPPEPVPEGLWSAIEGRLDATVQLTTPGVVPSRVSRLTERRKLPMPMVPALRWGLMAASLVLAAGLGYATAFVTQGRPEPVVVAVLLGDGASPGAIVEAYADDSVRLVPLDPLSAPEGQILQVWTLPDAETGPVSLGTFSQGGQLRLAGPDLPTPQQDQLYEITLEPAPGSPTGRPTGPIVLKGFAKAPLL